jgi:di/tripeptidase
MSLRVITKVRDYDVITNFRNYVTTLLITLIRVIHGGTDCGKISKSVENLMTVSQGHTPQSTVPVSFHISVKDK